MYNWHFTMWTTLLRLLPAIRSFNTSFVLHCGLSRAWKTTVCSPYLERSWLQTIKMAPSMSCNYRLQIHCQLMGGVEALLKFCGSLFTVYTVGNKTQTMTEDRLKWLYPNYSIKGYVGIVMIWKYDTTTNRSNLEWYQHQLGISFNTFHVNIVGI